ncbi:MAG: transferase [Planctomycetota bacterium]|nr:MAG: transferase [Planctomycetota bacterium]
MKDIVIIGAGGFAREVCFLIEEINKTQNKWSILGFCESTGKETGNEIGKYTVYCTDDELRDMQVSVAMGIGNPQLISRIIKGFEQNDNLMFPNLIHPDTIMDVDRFSMGKGNIICAGNIFTTDIEIGSFNIFNLNCTYGHDVRIGNYNVLNPGLNISGGVEIENECLIGTGATILNYRKIADGAVVGAGAVVTKDVSPGATVVGVPAGVVD